MKANSKTLIKKYRKQNELINSLIDGNEYMDLISNYFIFSNVVWSNSSDNFYYKKEELISFIENFDEETDDIKTMIEINDYVISQIK